MKALGFILIGVGLALDRLWLIGAGAAILYYARPNRSPAAAGGTVTIPGTVTPTWQQGIFTYRTPAAIVQNGFGQVPS